ncbi:hypothetical protein [Thiothrix lacustris]|uniref:hypothetical protein n=1 Tax=Thiothrix lacustris TaxID=525917 RepID=UPI0027E4702B|nr:hypothetical protein [Thiothrix lacustris]WMP17613.1 hypothetical protein RCS87_00760 [Thiothrix lacustris]
MDRRGVRGGKQGQQKLGIINQAIDQSMSSQAVSAVSTQRLVTKRQMSGDFPAGGLISLA